MVLFLVGFVPGWIVSKILSALGLLRVSAEAEEAGLDMTKVPSQAYPEGITQSAMPMEQ